VRYLGLDIGGTSVKAAVFNNGRCVRTTQSPPYNRPTLATLRAAIGEAAANVEDIAVVGLCLPGAFDAARGRLTHCVNIPALVGISLAALVRSSWGLSKKVPAHTLSDALAAAYDIRHLGRMSGRLLVLSLGTGVGCGILDGNHPLDVDHGSPGHLGQIDVTLPGPKVIGPDGGAGGLEGYIGSAALRKRHPRGNLTEALARYTGSEPPIQALVRALRIAHAIYRPQHICLCGGIGLALRHLVPVIRHQTQKHLTSLARPGWTLTAGVDVFHAARGAARMAARQG
jgi:predicted NBD/HSP70 family sugar kinase